MSNEKRFFFSGIGYVRPNERGFMLNDVDIEFLLSKAGFDGEDVDVSITVTSRAKPSEHKEGKVSNTEKLEQIHGILSGWRIDDILLIDFSQNGREERAAKPLQAIRDLLDPGWIKCSERVPDNVRRVLVTVTDKTERDVIESDYTKQFGWSLDDAALEDIGMVPERVRVIAWRELPQAYSGEV